MIECMTLNVFHTHSDHNGHYLIYRELAQHSAPCAITLVIYFGTLFEFATSIIGMIHVFERKLTKVL